jgi:hypothetical protein
MNREKVRAPAAGTPRYGFMANTFAERLLPGYNEQISRAVRNVLKYDIFYEVFDEVRDVMWPVWDLAYEMAGWSEES